MSQFKKDPRRGQAHEVPHDVKFIIKITQGNSPVKGV